MGLFSGISMDFPWIKHTTILFRNPEKNHGVNPEDLSYHPAEAGDCPKVAGLKSFSKRDRSELVILLF